MRNWLTFDGVSLKDFGVYINGGGTFNAPARSREVIAVPGRNGDLIIDNGRYENTDVVYHSFIYRDFAVNVEGLRNLLLSRTSYVRIEDTYHPDEYRLGVYTGNFAADVVDWLEAGEFDLTFNCKPQRFLKSGEESIPYKNHTGTILLNETGQIAKPLLRVYGTGSFRINESRLIISAANVYTDIDCELMDAYKGSDNRNQYVSGTFPELLPGENRIYTESLLDFLYITPRWWVL